MKVLLVPNYSRSEALQGADELALWLERAGVGVRFAEDKRLNVDSKLDTSDIDLVVSLGGDGTLLRAARIVGYSEIPVMGISYGHLGFLTCGGPEDQLELIDAALEGRLHASHRATLDVELEGKDAQGHDVHERRFALNDVSLGHGSRGDMIVFDVSVGGNSVDSLRGDGFVVATATGSTGYALAAGGPIVTPEFRGMVCVPVAPHTIMARAFLTSPDDVVEVKINPERNPERLFFADGQPMLEGCLAERALVRRGPGDFVLLERSESSFYQTVSRVFYGQA